MNKGRTVSSQFLKNKNSLLKVKILIVDDDSTCLDIVSSMLKTCSLQDQLLELSVVTVKNGLEALSTLQAKYEQFNLVLTDLHLPGINGWELQKQINEKFKIPVIIMSLDDRECVIAKSLKSGALLHIVKPVKKQDLKNIWQCAIMTNKKGKEVVNEETMGRNNKNNKNKDKNIVVEEEEIASTNNEEVSSASSVNEESSNNKNNNKKGQKRARGDDQDNEDVVAPKKAKVIWTNSLHNRFLQAINHIGLEKAVPKRILEFMNVPGLTRENVASHLQKYRMFLKKVAERGLWSSQAMSERILRSSFATGYNSNLINKNNFQFPQQPLSTFQNGHRGNFSTTTASSLGLSSLLSSSNEASSSNSAPLIRHGQSSLLSGGYNNFQRPLFGDTNRPYQPNQTRYGMPMQSNNAAINGFGTSTTPQMSMYQQQPNQLLGSNLQNLGNSSSFNFQSGSNFASTSTANNIGSTSTNFLPPFNPNSTNYAGIRLNNNGELGTNNNTGLSVGYGSTMNWASNNGNIANNTLTGNGLLGFNNVPNQVGFNSPASAFGNSLGQVGSSSSSTIFGNSLGEGGSLSSSIFGNSLGEGGSLSSSAIFGTGNQLPAMPFSVGNQGSTSMLTPNTNAGFENSGGSTDFAFNLINDVPNLGNTSDNQEELQDSDLDLFFGVGSINSTTPLQQQGVEGALNIESSYQPEINTNEFLNVEFSNSCTILDKSTWDGQCSQQGAETTNLGSDGNSTDAYFPSFNQSAETANLGSDGNSTDGYFPSFDQPQRNSDEPMESQLNDMDQDMGSSDLNQAWGEDILDMLLANNSYLTEN
ncbi:Two-component response regulator ARR1 [Euphorbia peplus]|nr:Two-component response regulator ARR1 [Euphorbia peplus]